MRETHEAGLQHAARLDREPKERNTPNCRTGLAQLDRSQKGEDSEDDRLGWMDAGGGPLGSGG